jgi:hypothetical protein
LHFSCILMLVILSSVINKSPNLITPQALYHFLLEQQGIHSQQGNPVAPHIAPFPGRDNTKSLIGAGLPSPRYIWHHLALFPIYHCKNHQQDAEYNSDDKSRKYTKPTNHNRASLLNHYYVKSSFNAVVWLYNMTIYGSMSYSIINTLHSAHPYGLVGSPRK